jgi:hypothetical protein
VPGGSRYPLGVYDDPPPEDVPLLRSMNVGGGLAAKGARWATEAADDITDLIDKLDGPL